MKLGISIDGQKKVKEGEGNRSGKHWGWGEEKLAFLTECRMERKR